MSKAAVQKILQRFSFSAGKAHGHGLGMMQVGAMLDDNNGKLFIQSKLGTGTLIELTFPKALTGDK
jgi:signal transduction histidine kinase